MTLALKIRTYKLRNATWERRQMVDFIKDSEATVINGIATVGCLAALGSTVTVAPTVDTTISVSLMAEIPVAEATAKAEAEATVAEAQLTQEVAVAEAQLTQEAQVAEAQTQQGFSKSSFTKFGMTIPVYDITDEFFFSNGVSTGDLQLTDAEYTALCKVVVVEAGGEPLAGKIIVANSVLNRVRLNQTDVITEVNRKNQFASIANISGRKITPEIRRAVDMALDADYTKGVLKAISAEQNHGSLWFYSPKYISEAQLRQRKNVKVAVRYGGHVFYGEWNK